MRRLSANDLIEIWETAQSQHPLDQALTILRAGFTENSIDSLVDLPVGERDRRLLQLRQETLGPMLVGETECPGCGERLEFEINTTDFLVEPPPVKTWDSEIDGFSFQIRMPTTRDIAAVMDSPADVARSSLAERCIVFPEGGERVAALTELPDALIGKIANQLAAADAGAESLINLECQACGEKWQTLLDIASYFLREIEALVKRLLFEVHVLAQAYGWNEVEILSLSAKRRQAYLDMVGYA